MDKKELQQLIKEEITKQSFNNGAMKKEELQKLQEALTDVMKYQMDEPDHEGEMAKSQMLKTMKYAADIMNMIDDTTELPAWVQSKLTKIASYIGAVKHHMESKTVRHVVTNMMESEEKEIKLTDLIVNEQSSDRDIMAISRMTGVPDYKIEAFLKRHRFKDLKKVKKLVKGMGIKKDEKFAKMVDGNFSLETEFKRMYKDS